MSKVSNTELNKNIPKEIPISQSREFSMNDEKLDIEFPTARRNSRRVTPIYSEGLNVGQPSRKLSINSQKWAFGTQLSEVGEQHQLNQMPNKRASVQLKNVKFLKPVQNVADRRQRSNTTPTKNQDEINLIVDSFKPKVRIHGVRLSDHSIPSITDSLRTSTSRDAVYSKNSSSDGIRSGSNTMLSSSPPIRSFQRDRNKSAGPPTSTEEVNRREELARLHEKRLSAFRSIPAPLAGVRTSRLSHVWPSESDKRSSRLSHVWVAEVQEQTIPVAEKKVVKRVRAKSCPARLNSGKQMAISPLGNPMSAH